MMRLIGPILSTILKNRIRFRKIISTDFFRIESNFKLRLDYSQRVNLTLTLTGDNSDEVNVLDVLDPADK